MSGVCNVTPWTFAASFGVVSTFQMHHEKSAVTVPTEMIMTRSPEVVISVEVEVVSEN